MQPYFQTFHFLLPFSKPCFSLVLIFFLIFFSFLPKWSTFIFLIFLCAQWRIQTFFGKTDFLRGFRGRVLGREAVMLLHGSRAKIWWGTGGKALRSFEDLVLSNQLLLIKIYPLQPVMKPIQRIFFKMFA